MVLPDTFLPDFVSIPLILAVLVASALTLSALIVFITSSASTRQEASHYLSPLASPHVASRYVQYTARC